MGERFEWQNVALMVYVVCENTKKPTNKIGVHRDTDQ